MVAFAAQKDLLATGQIAWALWQVEGKRNKNKKETMMGDDDDDDDDDGDDQALIWKRRTHPNGNKHIMS